MFLESMQEVVSKVVFQGSSFGFAPLASIPLSNLFLPLYVQVESTTKCNLRCKTCRRTNETNRDMSLKLFKSIVDEFKNSRFISRRLDLTGLGEPLLHPRLAYMVSYAKERGFRVSLTSNFTVVNRKIAVELVNAGLDYLYASFDGASKETFERIRVGADFDKVVENVKLFRRVREELDSNCPKLMFEITVSKDNVNEVSGVVELAESLGINGVYIYREVKPGKTDYLHDSFASIDWDRLARSRIEIQVSNPMRPPRPCVGVIGCYITFDGKVLPCNRIVQLASRAEYSHYEFGNIGESSLRDIWFTDEYRLFRKRVALGMYSSLCKFCPTCACNYKARED